MNHQRQRLRFTEPPRIQGHLDLAVVIRFGSNEFTVTQPILDSFTGKRRSVVVGDRDFASYCFASIVNIFFQLDLDLDRFQLVLSDFEARFERQGTGFVAGPGAAAMQVDAIVALRSRFGQDEIVTDRAKAVENDFAAVKLPAASVINIELEFLARPEREPIAVHPADDPLDVDQLPGAISRTIGKQISARREPHRKVQPIQVVDGRRHMSVVYDEGSQIADRLEPIVRLVHNAVVVG